MKPLLAENGMGMGERIRTLRTRADLSQAGFGRQFDVSRNAVSQWELETTTPEQEKLEKMSTIYGVTLDWISGKGDDIAVVAHNSADGEKKSLAETTSGRARSAPGEPDIDGPKSLKVLGFVKAGRVGFYPDNGDTLEMTERPPMLVGVPGAYAVYIDDRSMVPALKPGHLLWVHPRKPAKAEDYVIIQLRNGEAFVKEFIRKNDKGVFCKQYNPEEEIRYPADATIHLVVGIRTSG